MPELLRPSEAAFLPLDLKSVATDGVFEGYASLFDRTDLGNDIVLAGAFAEPLRRRGAAGIRMLFQHDPAQPIGVWDTLREDAKGLFVRGRLLRDVARAREVLSLMRAGAIDGLSIGFKAVRARRDRARGLRLIETVDLWEISVVTFPMLPDARIAAVGPLPAPPRTGHIPEDARFATKLAGLATYLRSTATSNDRIH